MGKLGKGFSGGAYMKGGEVYLVGAGSGDPYLITLKAIRLIEKCDVLIYDRLIDKELIGYANEKCKKIYVGKAFGSHSMKQEEINSLIVNEAKLGNMVVRLKGGDPFVFGRGGEEVMALKKEGIPFSVVSGVSSATAVPAAAGIPVTHRGLSRSFTVVTGHMAQGEGAGEDYDVLAKIKGTLIFLMGLSNIGEITRGLINFGKDKKTPAAVISGGTTKNQVVVRGNLEDICEKVKNSNVKSPAIIVVGEVCSLDFSSDIRLPLDGVLVGVTGTREFNQKLIKELRFYGAYAEEITRVKVKRENPKALKEAIEKIKTYSWIVFTSSNGVRIFFEEFMREKDIRELCGLKFAVIGSGTYHTLQSFGIKADLMPESYTAKELGVEISKTAGKNEKILIARAKGGSDFLNLELKDHDYEDLKIYDVCGGEEKNDGDFDFIVFGSSSAVGNFFEKGLELKNSTAVSIGDVTAKALRKAGVEKYIVAESFNAEGIVKKIVSEVKGID